MKSREFKIFVFIWVIFMIRLVLKTKSSEFKIFFESWWTNMRVKMVSVRSTSKKQTCFSFFNDLENETTMKEFEQYMEQENDEESENLYLIPLDEKFNILNWWKINGNTYPILQQIARNNI